MQGHGDLIKDERVIYGSRDLVGNAISDLFYGTPQDLPGPGFLV